MELPDVLARAAAAGVGEMVTIGTTLAQSQRLPAMTEAHPNLWCTVGSIRTTRPRRRSRRPRPRRVTEHPRVIGIGESGLDYFYDRAPRDVQQAGFRAHIRAARLAGVPLAIHARDADDDIALSCKKNAIAGETSASCCTASARRAGWPRRRSRWAAMSASPAS